MYPVQYLRNNITTRILGLGYIAKLVRTIAQDSVHKKRKKEKKKKREKEQNKKSRIHIVGRST